MDAEANAREMALMKMQLVDYCRCRLVAVYTGDGDHQRPVVVGPAAAVEDDDFLTSP